MSGTNVLFIRETTIKVYQFLWESRRDLLAMITVPVLALSLLSVAAGLAVPRDATTAEQVGAGGMLATIAVLIVSTLFYVMFAVAWHRRCLKPQEQTTIMTALKWDPRKTRFLFRSLAIAVVLLSVALPVAIILSILGGSIAFFSTVGGADQKAVPTTLIFFATIIIGGLFMLINGRLSLWLPAAAVDEPSTMLEAWNLGQGNTWRLAGIILLACAPGFLFFLVADGMVRGFSQVAGIGGSLTYTLFATLILNLANYIVIASGVSAVSFCYRQLRPTHTPGMPYVM